MNRPLYTLLLHLALPLVLLRLLWRSRRQAEYRRHIGERFGFYPPFQPPRTREGKIIWLHAVSLGETRAAAPLVQALQARYPDYAILLSHMTPTGRAAGVDLFGDRVLRCYLPYDYPWAVRRFLRHYRPAAGLLLETELWPNLAAGCRQSGTPLLLVNARLSEKSYRRYARFPALTRACLRDLSAVAAQSAADAQRLAALGAQAVRVLGNLKFDAEPPPAQLERGRELRQLFGAARPVFLAASTRDGEEALLLDALLEARPDWLSVIVPRHPQRFDEVAALLEKRGTAWQRRSANQPIAAATQAVLGDSMGEMFAYYAACDVAYIGGSLLPYGGQNLIEACAVGVPVLIGPHTYNFAEAAEQAVAAGAARRTETAEELLQQVRELLAEPERRQAMAQAGRAFAARHGGATRQTLEMIEAFLE
ncbi:MAG: lipid IV(A) 3-deoxy-D-manno-octulosonic acid transferase [Rhodocyclaceae bacterium]|nr:lipid IV(A) 3-deoxy-D-manno-octulosonic acid transferase [Rhodocyclaceae bacterium]